MSAWIKRLHRAEDALLALLLTTMVLLAGTQILLRNFFDAGLLWVDPILRVMVLWLGLIGAIVATRDNKHIRIDLLSRYFEKNTHLLIQSIIGLISAATCLVIGWTGMLWIRLDYAEGLVTFGGIPAWLLEIIVPLSFALIGLRYLALALFWARSYWQQRREDREPEA